MLVSILCLVYALNFSSDVATRQNKPAFAAIDMVKLKTKYPSLFADYHPAKFAYPDPSFIYYYEYQDTMGEIKRIGMMKKIEKVGYEFIGKEKINPLPYIELELSKGLNTRIYTSCGRKRSKPVYTADGIPINH